MKKYQHILIAVDFTEAATEVIEQALTIAQLMDSKVSLLHVVEPLPGYGYAFLGSAEVEIQLIEDAEKQIYKIGVEYDISKEDQYVEVGPTKMEIHRMVETLGTDLIVIGSHGRHGLGLLLGSTANAVLHGATCDVLTVRLKED